MQVTSKKNRQEQRALPCFAIQRYSYPNENGLSAYGGE
jgi:hypothetical protein